MWSGYSNCLRQVHDVQRFARSLHCWEVIKEMHLSLLVITVYGVKICGTGSESQLFQFHPGRREEAAGSNEPLLRLKELLPDLLRKENAKQFRANILSIDPQYEPIDRLALSRLPRMKQTRRCRRAIINFNVHVCP